ncbi:DUF1569 domain-containing protein [Thalassobellus citreus]|uniref:DUF1569 domain-containing protein n=1 Tax=Thalassobellus citreus TaxID=3367752 RepID=UPI0037B0C402
MANKQIDTLNILLNQLEKHIPFKDKNNTLISKSNVGWQLDHTIKVINAVSSVLAKTDPKKYKKNFNLRRTILFALGYIPRGKAKAPKTVLPPNTISTQDLISQLETAKKQIESIKALPKNAYFIHHIFGMLTKKQTFRFLEIHTKHHLKIVNDILNQ